VSATKYVMRGLAKLKSFVANASEHPASTGLPSLPAILERDDLTSARTTLQKALAVEKRYPVTVHKEWTKARAKLREYILTQDFSNFLQHPICRHVFFRTEWGPGQDYELRCLQASEFGCYLLKEITDPMIGDPDMSPRLPRISTNMLGMMYYLLRLRSMCRNGWPSQIVEVGGGYGAFSYLFCLQNPSAAYAIVDLPEMLSLQSYFLSQALPDRKIQLATSANINLHEGETKLIPVSLVENCHFEVDLFFSTFAMSEMPRRLQSWFENRKFWNARKLFLAGQLRAEAPEAGWVPHTEIVGAVMEQYDEILIERFHLGMNYLLQAHRTSRGDAAPGDTNVAPQPIRARRPTLDPYMRDFKQRVKRTPFYPPLAALRTDLARRQIIWEWRRHGRTPPPPPEVKHATIKQYAKRFRSKVLIETGTYLGDTIAVVKKDFADVYSIELSPELHNRARARFAADSNVHLLLGDSGDILKQILPGIARSPLFWLDAHYSGDITARGAIDTPIIQELDTIFALCPYGVVLIDDARCFDGTNSYPTLSQLSKFVADRAPEWVFEVKDDIIRLHAKTAAK
jgi:putative sugar O-methyltransferase